MIDLSGKTILVTGTSKGIGAAIARSLGAAGAHIVAHYGRDRAGTEAATEAFADRALPISADFGDPANVDALWQDAVAWRGGVDVLVNNAAIMRLAGGIGDDIEAWDAVWAEATNVNVLAPARLMRHAVRHFQERGGGIVVTISSWAAQRGSTNPQGIAYAASKAAIMAATKTVARGYARENILAYIVAPGGVHTQMSLDFAETVGGVDVVTSGLTMGEMIPPGEIGELVAFLSTGACRHLSGATFDINGASHVR